MFGEATYRLSQSWEATAGARAYRTRLLSDTLAEGALVLALAGQSRVTQHGDMKESGFNPKLALRYLFSRDIQFYALGAKGFQFGGIQLNPGSGSPVVSASVEQAGLSFQPYKSSTLWNYECGIRTEWLDHRLRLDVGAFYLDWKNLQLTQQVPISGSSITVGIIANVGHAHSQGIESALEVVPFDGAKWKSGATWIQALTDVPFDQDNSAGPVPAGTRLPGTPRFQWSNVVSYEHSVPFFENWAVGPIVTHTHVGRAPDQIRTTGQVGGYDTLDARFSIVKTDSRFQPEFGLGVTNLTDVRAVTSHSVVADPSGNGFDLTHLLQPRTAMLTLSARYQ